MELFQTRYWKYIEIGSAAQLVVYQCMQEKTNIWQLLFFKPMKIYQYVQEGTNYQRFIWLYIFLEYFSLYLALYHGETFKQIGNKCRGHKPSEYEGVCFRSSGRKVGIYLQKNKEMN